MRQGVGVNLAKMLADLRETEGAVAGAVVI